MPPQRLPIVDSDDGVWGDILVQYLTKEHYDTGTDNAANGGHKTVTIRAGTAAAGTASLKFTSGTLLSSPEAGAIEFNSDRLYLTQTTSSTRKVLAAFDDSSGATGDIYYRDSSGYFVRLPIGSSNDILHVSGGLPSWTAPTTYGDASTNTSSSVDSEIALFSGTDGKTLKRATTTGILKGTSGVISAATAGTDYVTGSSTNTFTNKTFDTAGTGNSFSINGLAATANTGTGSVVRATSPTLGTPVLGTATGTSVTWSNVATNTSSSSAVNSVSMSANPGSTTSVGTSYRGEFVQSFITAGNAQDNTNSIVYGGLYQAGSQGTATLGTAIGLSMSITTTSSASINTAQGFSTLLNHTSSGTVSTATGLNVASTVKSGGGTITTNSGIEVQAQTTGTTNYSIRTRAGLFVVNEDGADADWRFEGDTDQNLLFGDASADFVGIGSSSPNSKLHVAGSFSTPLVAKTAAYTLTASDHTVTGDSTSGAFNLTLPTAVGCTGREYVLKKIDSSINSVTANTTSSQTIDGATTYSLLTQYKYVRVQSDGANWIIVGNN